VRPIEEIQAEIAKLLAPAIDVRAPYAKHLVAALVKMVEQECSHPVGLSVGPNWIEQQSIGKAQPVVNTNKLADDLVRAAAERVIDRLGACINLTPDQAASIRRAACAITGDERAQLKQFVEAAHDAAWESGKVAGASPHDGTWPTK
jgi:hypothetical protein